MSNQFKLMFFSTLVMGTLLSISSYSWMSMWMGLEINLLSIIPLMNSNKNQLSSESSLKYFITQAVASSALLFSFISISYMESTNSEFTSMSLTAVLNSSLLMKMGAAPLHFWFPEIMEGLSWGNSIVMLTWQKIAPMMILMSVTQNTSLIYLSIISSMTIGGILGINQTSLRKILAYSSINHIGWMLASLSISPSIWLIYFSVYFVISLSLILIIKNFNIYHMSQLFNLKNNLIKISFLSNFLSMGGVPPFLGFLPKWITISALVYKTPALAIIMVVITLITLFLYIRSILPSVTLFQHEDKQTIPPQNNFLIWWINWFNIMSLFLCTLWFNLI